MKKIIIAALQAYKRWLSPALLPACRFVPSCSEYALEAIQHRGVIMGTAMAAWRLVRCNPLCRGGFDPVPLAGPHSHGRYSWPR